jgi:hypothetical protein
MQLKRVYNVVYNKLLRIDRIFTIVNHFNCKLKSEEYFTKFVHIIKNTKMT